MALTIKKSAVVGVIVLFCLMFSGIVWAVDSQKGKLSLHISGGLSFVDVKDINNCIQSRENNPTRYTNMNWEKVKSNSDFDLEVIYNLSDKIGIGLGTGYAFFNNEGDYGDDDGNIRHERWKWSAIPVFSNLYVILPIQYRWTLIVKGGVGYYFSTLNGYKDVQWDRRPDVLDYGIARGDIKATSGAFAVNAGLGFDFRLAKNVLLSLEGNYRLLKAKDFKGTQDIKRSLNSVIVESYQVEGYLWHCEFSSLENPIHDSFFQNEPDQSYLRNQRHAEYNLSGFTLKLGLKYSFASLARAS